MIFELTHHMALLPLLMLLSLSVGQEYRGTEWWWIAGAFAISWVADTASHFTDPWRVSLVYPVAQAALIGAVLLERDEAWAFLATLVAAGLLAAWLRGDAARTDVLLRTVAWGSVAGIVASRPQLGRLRQALLVSFGLGLVAWLGYVAEPGWPTWLAYQAVRATGLVLFGFAAFAGTTAQLRLAR